MSKRIRFSAKAEKMLREIGKKKRFTKTGGTIRYIRRNFDGYAVDEACPIKAIMQEKYPETQWCNFMFVGMGTPTESQYQIAEKVGLTPQTIRKIVNAADWTYNPYRPRLLHLLGLSDLKEN